MAGLVFVIWLADRARCRARAARKMIFGNPPGGDQTAGRQALSYGPAAACDVAAVAALRYAPHWPRDRNPLEDTLLDWKVIGSTFTLIFLAELGDKTQLALFSHAAKTQQPVSVLIGGGAALLLTTALAVVIGGAVGRFVPEQVMRWVAGLLFVGFGVLILLGKG